MQSIQRRPTFSTSSELLDFFDISLTTNWLQELRRLKSRGELAIE